MRWSSADQSTASLPSPDPALGAWVWTRPCLRGERWTLLRCQPRGERSIASSSITINGRLRGTGSEAALRLIYADPFSPQLHTPVIRTLQASRDAMAVLGERAYGKYAMLGQGGRSSTTSRGQWGDLSPHASLSSSKWEFHQTRKSKLNYNVTVYG